MLQNHDIFDVNPAGEVITIFPNPFQIDNFCQPGITYQVPPVDAEFTLEVTAPAGTDRMKAIASVSPINLKPNETTRGIRFSRKIVKSAPTRANITFNIR